jgi:NAD-specific glutamate dehydrogenase
LVHCGFGKIDRILAEAHLSSSWQERAYKAIQADFYDAHRQLTTAILKEEGATPLEKCIRWIDKHQNVFSAYEEMLSLVENNPNPDWAMVLVLVRLAKGLVA